MQINAVYAILLKKILHEINKLPKLYFKEILNNNNLF